MIPRVVVFDEVQLVDREQHVLHPEHREDRGVPAGLRLHARARIHQHDPEFRVRRAAGHVAGVLRVAGAIGDNEGALVGAEVTPRDVDGDALLALGFQAVEQQ